MPSGLLVSLYNCQNVNVSFIILIHCHKLCLLFLLQLFFVCGWLVTTVFIFLKYKYYNRTTTIVVFSSKISTELNTVLMNLSFNSQLQPRFKLCESFAYDLCCKRYRGSFLHPHDAATRAFRLLVFPVITEDFSLASLIV